MNVPWTPLSNPRSNTRSDPTNGTPARSVVVAAPLLMIAVVAAGCTSVPDDSLPEQTSVIATDSSVSDPEKSVPSTATSDVQGRRYDLASVTRVAVIGGKRVLELDRWTLPGTSDSSIARDGIPLAAHEGSQYQNQNTDRTYSAPLADEAIVVINRCVRTADGSLGLVATPQSATRWLIRWDRKVVFVITYDDGAITRMDTEPACQPLPAPSISATGNPAVSSVPGPPLAGR